MRRVLWGFFIVLLTFDLGGVAKAGNEYVPNIDISQYYLGNYKPVYNRAYGYPNIPNYRGGGYGYGNSAPYQGNFRFPPGFGYGSIYGNSGHPGFRRYTGPAWQHPAAWGR